MTLPSRWIQAALGRGAGTRARQHAAMEADPEEDYKWELSAHCAPWSWTASLSLERDMELLHIHKKHQRRRWFNYWSFSFSQRWASLVARGKESACNATASGDLGLIPGSGRSPGGVHGNPLQYFYLENPKDRGTWWTLTVHRVTKSQTGLKWLSSFIKWAVVKIAFIIVFEKLLLCTWSY